MMNRLNMRAYFLIIAAGLLTMPLTGCMSRQMTYPHHTPNQVWTAMQAVANSPQYADWHVTTNEVWVDQQNSRIEVYREVRRTLYRPKAKPQNQRRTWRLQCVLLQQDPPTVRVVSRGMNLPGNAMDEADRYLIDVRRILQTEIAPIPTAPAAEAQPPVSEAPTPQSAEEPETAPDTVDTEAQQPAPQPAPPVDIDDLD